VFVVITVSRGAQIWLLSLVLVAVLAPLAFVYVDLPVARFAQVLSGHLSGLGENFGGAILLSIEGAALLVLALVRIVLGHLPRWATVFAVALLTSVCAYAINSSVLKVVFGVPPVWEVILGVHHGLDLFQGTQNSSFPSGHMMLAGGFAGVILRFYRVSVLPLSLLLAFGAALLVLGGWHFVSDVIAGTFLGVSAGLLAGEVWCEHESQQ
jgi:membrane-associated phospholipid phosphatase